MRIGLAGDWHANFNATRAAIKALKFQQVDAILHVGDFGFNGHAAGAQFLDLVSKHLGDTIVYVTPGNHEDYDYLQSVDHVTPWNQWCHVRNNIAFARRGFTWEWDSITFMSLGGAPSVDRQYRMALQRDTGKKHWWAEEEITEQDVDTALVSAERYGPIDVMIGHDAPFYKELDQYIAPNPFGFPQIDLQYAHEGRKRMHRAAHGIMPELFVHGHYHVPFQTNIGWSSYDEPGGWHTADVAGVTRVLSLNKEMDPGSLAILDTKRLTVEVIN